MKKVAVFPGVLDGRTGGAVRSAVLHAAALAQSGIEAWVFGLVSADHSGKDDIPYGDAVVRRYPVRRSGASVISRELLNDFAAMAGYFDLVHLNGHWRTMNYRLAHLCRLKGVPYIVSSRGTRRAPLCPGERRTIERLAKFERQMMDHASCLHMTSNREIHQAELPDGHPPVALIPNALCLEHIVRWRDRAAARERLGIAPDGLALLYFGRVAAEKNVDFILHVLARLPDASAARLYVVGAADPDYRARLEALADRLGIAERIRFVGYVWGRDRAEWLVACDVFLLPSHGENFALALIEAVATGMTCLASDKVGAVEYLSPVQCEVLPLDVERWAERCAAALARKREGTAAPNHEIIDLFSPARVLAQWQSVYAARTEARRHP